MSPETLDLFIKENRLIRGAWTGKDDQGRETACLLAALSPEVFKAQSPDACPAALMPQWLARLTVFIDDNGTLEHWPDVVKRYAGLAARWHVLTPEAWNRSMHRVNRASVLEAMSHTKSERSLGVCKAVLALFDRAIAGDPPTPAEWEAAGAEAAARWAEAAARRAEAAADRMIDAWLDILEDEIKKAEAA